MNKKRYLYIIVLFLLVACQKEEMMNRGVGYVQFSVEKDVSTIPMTRVTDLPIALQIINKSGEVIKETNDWNNWASSPLELPLGSYTVKAFSKDIDSNIARFDEPYYVGQTEIVVVPKVNQSVNIECRLADVKVSVTYSSDVRKYFKKLNCKVSNKSGELSFAKDETRSGYFVAEDLKVALALTNTDGASFVYESDPITNVAARQHYRINYSMKANSSLEDVSITIDPTTKEYKVDIFISKEAAPLVMAWANFADVSLSVSEEVVDKICKYRISGTEIWQSVSGEQVKVEKGKVSTRIMKLIPNQSYDFCFVINGKEGKIVTAITENDVQVPNSNFDEWNIGQVPGLITGKKDGWFAGTKEEAASLNSFWDSGNVGAAMMGSNPTSPESTDVHTEGGKAAKLASEVVSSVKFAAGNIYVGHYCETFTNPSSMGARIRFGRPFTSRPTQLKGWYKYTRGTKIDKGDHNKTELESSGGDKCAIYIALTDNEGLDGFAYEINNHASADQPQKFIYQYTLDLSEANKDVIAYGSITDEESKGSFDESGNVVWKPFTIDLQYRDLTRKPKYIIIVASASKYGDFFTGSKSSVMLIDDFELVYGTPVTAN